MVSGRPLITSDEISAVRCYDQTRTRAAFIFSSDLGLESAIDNRPPSNIGRACVTTKEAKRKIITASER